MSFGKIGIRFERGENIVKNLFLKKAALFMATVVMSTSVLPYAPVLASQTGDSEPVEEIFESEDYYDEEDVLGKRDNVKGDGYWHFSDGILRYNKESSGAITDFDAFKSEYGDQVKKVVIESGPKKYTEDYDKNKNGYVEKCNFLSNLEEVVYESPVTITNMCLIFKGMYRGNPKLRKVVIGDAKEDIGLEIGQEAFRECPELKELSFGKRLWYFNKEDFCNDTSLTDFTFPRDIRHVRGDTFARCPNMKNVKFASKNDYMRIADNVVYAVKDNTTLTKAYSLPCLMYVPEGIVKENGGNYTIVKGTKDIQWGTFRENLSLENVTVASTVESIQEEAFYGCDNIKTVTLPRSLKRIGRHSFSGLHSDDVYPVSASLTDIYYEGSEEEWKKIKYAEYNLTASPDDRNAKGYVDNLQILNTSTFYNHLEDVGIPADVKIHYNCTVKDTEKSLNELIGADSGNDNSQEQDVDAITPSVNKVTVSYNGPGAKELSTLGAKMELTYTDELTYCGRKHVLTSAKPSASAINDLVADAAFKKISASENTSEYKISKVTIKNNKNAASKSSPKPPYFTIQIKAMKPLSKEEKAVLKEVNRSLKKDPAARFYFTINPLDVSSFSSGNYKGLTVDGSEAKIKKVGFKYSYMKNGAPFGGWKFLKQCKNNDAGAKGDYTLKVEGNNVILTGHGNYTGTAVFTK